MIDPLKPTEEFQNALRELGVELEPGEDRQLGLYLALLLEANERVNLTAITDPAQAWMRHILDALTLVPFLGELPEGERVIDVGSGGGVPGLPLAIVLPSLGFTLLEPTGKKAAFLREAAGTLGLKNVTVVSDRAEKLGQDKARHREKHGAVLSRAVANLNVLAELTIPLCRQGGVILAIKGAKADEEVRDAARVIGLLGARHVDTHTTPTGRIIVLEKASKTPNLYPRRDGEPKRDPLT